MNERAGLGFFLQVRLRQLLDRLIDEAAREGLLDDPVVADASASCTCAPRSCDSPPTAG